MDSIGEELKAEGFTDKSGVKHVTLAYNGGWEIPNEGNDEHPEYKKIVNLFKTSNWQIDLMYGNAETGELEKRKAFSLMTEKGGNDDAHRVLEKAKQAAASGTGYGPDDKLHAPDVDNTLRARFKKAPIPKFLADRSRFSNVFKRWRTRRCHQARAT